VYANLIVVEILSITNHFILKLALLLDLVIFDVEWFARFKFDSGVFGFCRCIRSSETNEGKTWSVWHWLLCDCIVWSLVRIGTYESHRFNLTEIAEDLSQLLLSDVFGEISHVKVASFLRQLILSWSSLNLLLALSLIHRGTHVKRFFAVWELFSVHLSASFLSTSWPILSVFRVGAVKADEVDSALIRLSFQ